MQKVKVGVVGVGQMGRYHVGVYSELSNVDLVGIADKDQRRAQEIARQYNIRSYADYHDLIGRVDIVSIAVPTSLHYTVACDFLKAGVHVLLEKPIAHALGRIVGLFEHG